MVNIHPRTGAQAVVDASSMFESTLRPHLAQAPEIRARHLDGWASSLQAFLELIEDGLMDTKMIELPGRSIAGGDNDSTGVNQGFKYACSSIKQVHEPLLVLLILSLLATLPCIAPCWHDNTLLPSSLGRAPH